MNQLMFPLALFIYSILAALGEDILILICHHALKKETCFLVLISKARVYINIVFLLLVCVFSPDEATLLLCLVYCFSSHAFFF